MTNTFHQNSKATIGVEFFTRIYQVNNKIIRLEIWDTAGEERYKSITSVYYKGAKGAFIVYDITSRKSFNNLVFFTLLKSHTNNFLFILLLLL